jgi:predicted ATPase/DNA-binding SARP family transcriptional activator
MDLSVRVLGPLDVAVDGFPRPVSAPKQRALLGVLVAAAGQPVAARRLVEELWPDEPPATATVALQVHVSGLRKVVGARLVTTPGGYRLDLPPDAVDARRFEALATAARHAAEPPRVFADRLAGALTLWRGPAFDGVPAGPAVRAARVRLEELRLRALEEWAKAALAAGDHATVVADLSGLVAANPTRERLTGLLMLALYRCDRRPEARDAYAGLRRALRRLGVDPGEEVAALAAAMDRRDPTLTPPAAALPAPVSRFIGRRRELEHLAHLLGRHRLLTLLGPGGCGKTRLALELCRDMAAAHPDGVHVVELAGLTAPDAVAARVAAVIGVREQPAEPVDATLSAYLRHSRALVVLDNCEHLGPAVAAVTGRLLRECSGLRVLATTREPLGVDGETVWSVSGLAVPAGGEPADVALRGDAVRLLADRAAAARPGFRLRTTDADLAVTLCRRLDGLPLAIELAAARLRALSLPDLVARLDRRLDLPARRSAAAVGRHRTMRAAIDWSYELLSPAEQKLFGRLSVFAGSFPLDAVEEVTGEPDRVIDLLAGLVDQSVLVALPDDGGSRYRMLETIQQYAAERLGSAPGVRTAHAAWYRRLVEQAPPMGGADHEHWLHRFGIELDNLRAALDWALGDGDDPETGLAIAAGVWWYWWVTGQMAEGRMWLDRALATGRGPTALRGAALRAAASLARSGGDFATARRHGEDCLEVYRTLDDPAGTAAALNGLAITCQALGDFETSLRHGYASLDRASAAGNTRGTAVSRNTVAGTLRCMGRLDEAETLFTEALDGFRAAGDRRGSAAALTNLAIVARRRGDPAGSRRLALDSLAGYRELALAEGQLDMLEALACLDVAAGRPAPALRLLLVADRERRRLGAPVFTPDEVADRAAALSAARAALTPAQAGAVAAEAAAADLAAVVDGLLTEPAERA